MVEGPEDNAECVAKLAENRGKYRAGISPKINHFYKKESKGLELDTFLVKCR